MFGTNTFLGSVVIISSILGKKLFLEYQKLFKKKKKMLRNHMIIYYSLYRIYAVSPTEWGRQLIFLFTQPKNVFTYYISNTCNSTHMNHIYVFEFFTKVQVVVIILVERILFSRMEPNKIYSIQFRQLYLYLQIFFKMFREKFFNFPNNK